MANRIRAALRKIFNWGITAEIIDANPVFLVPAPGKERQRDRVLTEEEIKKIWNALDADRTNGDALHRREKFLSAAISKLRLLTAQRGAEVMDMEWSEIDGDWWTIPGEKTKNGPAHRVPLTAPAQVHKLMVRICNPSTRGLVVTTRPFDEEGEVVLTVKD